MPADTADILAFCGAISVIGGAIIMIGKFLSPLMKLSGEVEDNIREIESINQKLARDHTLLEESEKADRLICRSLLDITSHMIHGNHVDEMKKTQKDMLDFLAQ